MELAAKTDKSVAERRLGLEQKWYVLLRKPVFRFSQPGSLVVNLFDESFSAVGVYFTVLRLCVFAG